ncbi:MAG: 50S ribosomal protein L3 [Microgenomates group bacterium GW2011_GWF2_45_18]|nr:MAG: 50S ribosomal protein L3 [Microgenomates group bacterium GW2011_GWF1_44_10]KKU01967.1 MAG: 50S ribosomal protein L3 [Microgenomates group bacterium GW2011_GWF2_45_18]OGJ41019.1 MAG: 50S ribosomal protein L3 [Candidatus Pacebacteria bacterium RIFOXYB1_FULL_44_10]HAU99048.1 50S ribosomal protein L3 [Candidatus Paceibacterota bacterium]HAX01237.1 50S ribosomal protein L3 [Candidatus Paceibacterota bacterium]
MKQLYAIKRESTQAWTKSGKRIPVTVLHVDGNVYMKQGEKVTIGFQKIALEKLGSLKKGFAKKLGMTFGMKKTKEVLVDLEKEHGTDLLPSEMFTVGDIVDVCGTSKGMGFAGGMKLHGFHGGPRTHGQSDRARAPGASSSGTTPGRLYKNKRMAGRGGNRQVTVENLQIVSMNDETKEILVKGVIPGAINGMVIVLKVADGKFEGLQEKKG